MENLPNSSCVRDTLPPVALAKMGKSIRSKSKRKFRAVRRRDIYAPDQRKKQMEALSNLRRSIGSQHSTSANSIDTLRAMVRGEQPSTTPVDSSVLPDASDALGLSEFKEEMDEAEAAREMSENGHFHFKTRKNVKAWHASKPTEKMLSDLLKYREEVEKSMELEKGESGKVSQKKKTKSLRERRRKKKGGSNWRG